MGIGIIVFTLCLLIFLAFRGVSILILAPALAVFAAALSGLPVLASYTQIFMPNTGAFIVTYFPLFLLGAVFGKLMEDSGAAKSIGDWSVHRLGERRAMMAIILSCGLLTYGGVSLFVVAFAVYPLAAAVFRKADLPARLIPGTIALGSFTFTMTALPGTPAIQNAIPMPYFGTTAFAAPGLGLLASAIMLAVGYGWLHWRADHAAHIGEGYARTLAEDQNCEGNEGLDTLPKCPLPSLPFAIAPIVLVVVLNLILSRYVFPRMNLSYLASEQWGAIAPSDIIGIWAITVSLSAACLSIFILNPRWAATLFPSLGDGAGAAVIPIFNTACLVGFGAVIASLPAFETLRESILSIAPGNPLVSLSIAVNILAGITGSASGGMSIALDTLGARYLELGTAAGFDPAVLHRVTAVATGGLDALPHNGAVVTLLSICGMSHAKSYLDIFVVALLGPLLALAAIVLVASL